MRLGRPDVNLLVDPFARLPGKKPGHPQSLAWMGWLIFLMEALVAIPLILGIPTRLGGLAGLLQALNLFFGVSVFLENGTGVISCLPS